MSWAATPRRSCSVSSRAKSPDDSPGCRAPWVVRTPSSHRSRCDGCKASPHGWTGQRPVIACVPMRSVRQHVNPLGLNFRSRGRSRIVVQRASRRRTPGGGAGLRGRTFLVLYGASVPGPSSGRSRNPGEGRGAQRAPREGGGSLNLYFGYVNLNVDLDRVFEPGTVDRFHLLFPIPGSSHGTKTQGRGRVVRGDGQPASTRGSSISRRISLSSRWTPWRCSSP